MTEKELQHLVEKISLESFSKKFAHSAVWNRRLRSTGGRYLLKNHALEFNPSVLQFLGLTELEKIIKHELCHYHLHLERRGYKHSDADFKKLLTKVGGSRYTPQMKKAQHNYECSSCGQQYARMRRLNTNRFGCGKCRGKLVLLS
ncbi:MAG: SprT family protein [Streptococcaceae bacterium]|nr:SprT family protein [Streptococcaceae bacterium]